METTRMLAENVVKTTYGSLPPEVIEKTKRHILDILGVMFPSSTFEKGCKALEEITREGGKHAHRLWGEGALLDGRLCQCFSMSPYGL